MSRTLSVHLLPSLTSPDSLAGGTVVVIDVLRATTTMIHALAAGAREVLPCLEVEEARQLAGQRADEALLGGERGGRKIAGFNLGNSPAEYTAATVAGRTLVFSTTNGTRAMRLCGPAHEVYLGAFVNFSAVCDRVRSAAHVHLLCAGTDGQITREDVLFAGAVVDDLVRTDPNAWQLNDAACIAADAWRAAARDFRTLTPLAECLRASRGGRNLVEIGHERDIEIAAQLDRFSIVPRVDTVNWRITA